MADPLFRHPFAGVAQLVERQLPKLNVAGSSPVARSHGSQRPPTYHGGRWRIWQPLAEAGE